MPPPPPPTHTPSFFIANLKMLYNLIIAIIIMIEGNFNIEVQIQVESPTCVSQLQIDARYMSFEKYEKLKSAFLYENLSPLVGDKTKRNREE
jgi:hypothetical protein